MIVRSLVSSLVALAALACSTPTADVSGDAFAFNEGVDSRVAGARVFVLEDPNVSTTTDATGHFLLSGLPVGSDVTLVMEHPDFIPIQTGTIELGAEGAERVTFHDVLASLLMLTVDPERCHSGDHVRRARRM